MGDDKPITEQHEVLARAHAGWAELQSLVDDLDDEQAAEPLGDGWSAKAHIAHIAAWEASTAALLRKQHRWAPLGISRELWESEDVDAINAAIANGADEHAWTEVRRAAVAAHDDLIGLVESMTQEQLDQPYSDYAPDDPPYSATPVVAWVNGNTWDHYNEHIEWISAGLRG